MAFLRLVFLLSQLKIHITDFSGQKSTMMLYKTFAILAIVAASVVGTNVINLDNIFTSSLVFHRDHGYALIGHVIKTLNVFIADCMSACQETLSCFSFNYIDFHNGTFLCELNRSNKKQSSGSYIRKEGYEYAEPPVSIV